MYMKKVVNPKNQTSEDKDATAKRPVLTISLNAAGMANLDQTTEAFKLMAQRVPSWFELPKTKAAVAAWLINRHAVEIDKALRAILWERDCERSTGGEGKYVEPVFPQWPFEDDHGLIIKKVSEDPFLDALRNLLKLPKE
jgi:hypothetical protein